MGRVTLHSLPNRQARGQCHESSDRTSIIVTDDRIFTHNRADFEALARESFAAGKTHYGIIIAVRHPAQEIVRRLLRLLNQVMADEMQDQIGTSTERSAGAIACEIALTKRAAAPDPAPGLCLAADTIAEFHNLETIA
jgi:hypothetical protein